jgi:hypothetical protein
MRAELNGDSALMARVRDLTTASRLRSSRPVTVAQFNQPDPNAATPVEQREPV